MFEKFGNKNLKKYGLCPGNYLSAKQELKHIIHLDVNNLHSYTMSIFLPTNGFKSYSLTWINILAIVQKDVFLKLIMNILELARSTSSDEHLPKWYL